MIKYIKPLIERWKSESPEFWKKVLKISLTLGVNAVSILGLDKMLDLQSYGVPQLVFTICGYVIVACGVLGLASKLTIK